jgi:hypothetical protein
MPNSLPAVIGISHPLAPIADRTTARTFFVEADIWFLRLAVRSPGGVNVR